MSTDLEHARRAEPAWDEVRERRVLARVLGERDARSQRASRLRRAALAGAVLAAAAAIIAVADVALAPERVATELGAGELGAGELGASELGATDLGVGEVERSGDRSGHIALSEGSEIELRVGARVEVASESPSEVRIVQAAGEARYVVSHLPSRRFVVACGDVEVVVRGTRFVVRREPTAVEVEVEEGRVEVIRGEQHSLLTRGESLRMADAPSDAEPPAVEAVEARDESTASPEDDDVRESVEATSERRRPVDVDALLRQADSARRDGRLADASRALSTAIDALGRDPRSVTALFTLGRVERTRARHAAAATAFESAYARDPGAILAEDALAEATVSWADAGRAERASASAERYLSRYPTGQYVERVRRAVASER